MNDFVITEKGIIDIKQEFTINVNADRSVYEVIRLIDGVALFMEDHFERLLSSARMSGIQLNMQMPEFGLSIEELMIANG
ncbi:MAG: hypothetical protein ACM3RX_01500, partial [Methanococcaceae archaeon]